MFPIGDDRGPGGSTAVVVIALIVLNVLAFLIELTQPSQDALQAFIQAWGVVPHEYVVRHDLPPTIPLPFWSTLFTSMFLHAGWMHLGGNMLYLWIFGDNLERVMGHGRFLVFYLICGIAAGVAQIVASGASNIPSLGASGAVSAVIFAGMILEPRIGVGLIFIPGVRIPGYIFAPLFLIISHYLAKRGRDNINHSAHIWGAIFGIVFVIAMAFALSDYNLIENFIESVKRDVGY